MPTNLKNQLSLQKDIKKINYWTLSYFLVMIILFTLPLVSYQVNANSDQLKMNGLALMFAGQFFIGLISLALNLLGLATALMVEIQKYARFSFLLGPWLNLILIFILTNLPNTKLQVGAWLSILLSVTAIFSQHFSLIKIVFQSWFKPRE